MEKLSEILPCFVQTYLETAAWAESKESDESQEFTPEAVEMANEDVYG